MGRIIAIDYGAKRTGLAWTDPERIIATGLESLDTQALRPRLQDLIAAHTIDAILLGYPLRMDGSDTHATAAVREFEAWIKATWPQMEVIRWDERLTSKMAMQSMVQANVNKKRRRDKYLINQVAATIMLQEYLQHST